MKKSTSKLHPPTQTQSVSHSKIQKKLPLTPTNKKKEKSQPSNSKITKQYPSKNKQPLINNKSSSKSQPQDFIIINDSIYSANTFTQRNNYEQFLTKVKKQKQIQRKSFLVKSQLDDKQLLHKKARNQTMKKFEKVSPTDLIQTMTLEQKKQMFYQLQQEIRGRGQNDNIINANKKINSHHQTNNQNNINQNPYYGHKYQNQPLYGQSKSFQQLQNLSQRSQVRKMDSQRQRKQKFSILQQKVDNLKMQLMFKWQGQIDKLQQMFMKGKLTEKQKINKINMIEKIKDHKLKILDCTKTLFQKILKQQQYEKEHNQQKTNKIQAILQSLHSFPSLESMQQNYLQKQPNIDHLKIKQPLFATINTQNSSNDSNQKINQKKPLIKQIQKQSLSLFGLINKKLSPKKKTHTTNTQTSPLEIVQNNSHDEFINQFLKNGEVDTLVQQKNDDQIDGQGSRVKFFKEQSHIGTEQINNLNFQSKETYNSLPKQRFAQMQDQSQGQFSHLNQQFIYNSHPEEQNFSGQQPQILNAGKLLFKLDLRLDQVVFGQDQYPQNQKQQQNHALQNQDTKSNILSQVNEMQSKNISQTSFDRENNLPRQNDQPNIRQTINYTSFQNSLTNLHQQDSILVINRIQSSINNNISCPISSQQQPKSPQTPNKYSLSSLLTFNSNKNPQIVKQKNQQHPIFTLNQQKETQNILIDHNKPQIVQQQSLSPSLSNIYKLSIPLPKAVSPVSSPSVSIQYTNQQTTEQQDESLICKQEIRKQEKININIPLILTRDKMENLQYQKNKVFRQNMDRRIAFQMGCIEIVDPAEASGYPVPHFTTLVDINTYIVGFYEFMMRKYVNTLVDNLNIPYGKSVIDKLYSLQVQGFILEQTYNQMNNILSQASFFQYQKQINLTMHRCTQYQTAHNRAIFQAFTKSINAYRPYYQLQGQVYPWVVSQKGITFYEINEDNIQQVFQKSKIKVLQYCTTLCGLHPPSQIINQDQKAMINSKCEENLSKMIKNQIVEQYLEWSIRFVNFQCLIKLIIAQEVYYQLCIEVVEQMVEIDNKNMKEGE